MEYENKYASKATAGTALGIAIGSGVLSLANGNGLGGILGGNNCAGHAYSRYDAEKDAKIAALETEVKLRDSNIYTDSKILALYEKMDARFNVVEREICDQRTYNAVNTATIGCIQGQVATLLGLTKTVVPIASICPTPAVATTTT